MILVTHNDLDGAGCEIVARWFYSELTSERIYHCDYDVVDSLVERLLSTTTDKIIIADISVKKEPAIEIEKNYKDRVELFDHHQTVIPYLGQYSWVKLDMARCGTKLLFDTLQKRYKEINVPKLLEDFVFYVNDYDLWIHSSPISSQINDMLYLLGLHVFAENMLQKMRANQPLIGDSDQLDRKSVV